MRVTDIIRHKGADVATVEPGATLADAAQILAVRRIGALVVSEDGSGIDGIISERDIVRHVAEWGPEALRTPVRDAMTTDVRTCTCDDSVDQLMAWMTDHRVRHLPVIDAEQMVGIVSIGDVVKHRVQQLEAETEHLTHYIQTGR